MDVDADVEALVRELETRLGIVDARDGRIKVKFGVLVRDERCADMFEGLNGTLRAAKRRKRIDFEGEMLLQGAHDDVDVVVLQGCRERDES
ncbi:Costars domain [Ostreococcus tauri]|uniref:Costars domain n=1 Tax=Ostreococcus tauri TaxID=70448 RepID=A0A090M6M0_OSTTA|nr:Costars domain [Ostreococcus tauri]CEF99870.1 Costars domain [Ostreococcus tauri]|eukprot:XP_022840085.1 Costars domain [Ostreococcus tauri]